MALNRKVIRFDEFMVGVEHPSLDDTLNRALLIDHDQYGGHVRLSYTNLINKSGDQRSLGDVVVQDLTTDGAFVTTPFSDDGRQVFVVGATTEVNVGGYLVGYGYILVNVRGNVVRGEHLAVSALRTPGVVPLSSSGMAVTVTSHGLANGDFVELTSGLQVGQVRRVTAIVDPNNFTVDVAFSVDQIAVTWSKVEAGKAKAVGFARSAGSFAVALTGYAGGALGQIAAIVYGTSLGATATQPTIALTNKSGINRLRGEVGVIDRITNLAFAVNPTPSDQRRVVVLVEDILKDAVGQVQGAGVALINVRGNVVRGDALVVSARRFPAANAITTTAATANSTAHGLVVGDWIQLTSGAQNGQLRYVIAVADANNVTLDSAFSVNQASVRWSKVEVGRAESAGPLLTASSFAVALTSFTGTTGTVQALMGQSAGRSVSIGKIMAIRQLTPVF